MSDNGAATPLLVNVAPLLPGDVPSLLQLPPELLNLILDQANLEDLNCLRLVCKKLKKAVEKQNTLRWSCNLHWQLPTSELTELRQHLVRKLAESFLKGYDLSKVTAIMMVWAHRLEGEAFEKAASKDEYTSSVSTMILARHRTCVENSSCQNQPSHKSVQSSQRKFNKTFWEIDK